MLSYEYFNVAGALLEAAASLKGFRSKEGSPPSDDDPRNPSVDFRGESRSNEPPPSTTDHKARLLPKGRGKDRIVSVYDSEMCHGCKCSQHRFDS